MDKDRLNSIMKEALRLKKAGLEDEAQRVAKIAKMYRDGQEMGVVSAALIGVADGITASWGDEIAAGVYALGKGLAGENVGENYNRVVGKLRDYQQEAALTSPYAKGTGEIVGAVGSMALGPAWLQTGEKGVESIQGMKAAQGLGNYMKAGAKAVNTFGKPAAIFGAIQGAGKSQNIRDMPRDILEGAAGGYVIGGLLGTTVGNIFYKSPIPGKGQVNTKAQVLNRARADFGDEFVKDNENTILEFHDLVKKHGFKGKEVEDALKEAEATGKDLDTKLTNFMKKYSEIKKGLEDKGYVPGQKLNSENIPPLGEKGDPTEISARELIDGFKKSLHSINKEALDHQSEENKLTDLVMGMTDDTENNSIRTLGRKDARWKRTGQEPDRVYGTEPMEPSGKTESMHYQESKGSPSDIYGAHEGEPGKGEWIEFKTVGKPGDILTGEPEVKAETVRRWVPYGKDGQIPDEVRKAYSGSRPIEENLLDKKLFNVEGQRRLLNFVNSKIKEGDRFKVDKDVAQKFAAYVRGKYQGNLDYLSEQGHMDYGMESGVTPETPKNYHEIITLRDAFEKGASKKLKEEAEKEAIQKTPLIGKALKGIRTWTYGNAGKTKEAIKAAEEYFARSKPPTGLLEITPEDMADLKGLPPDVVQSMKDKFKPKPIIEHPATRGKIGETTYDMLSPDVTIHTPNYLEQQKQDQEEKLKDEYQHQKDQEDLQNTQMFRTTEPSEGDRMNNIQSSISPIKSDKLIAAVKRARNNGEIISPSDPDFKKKIRKYLVDSESEYA